jgi:16S rRNA (uracil1498-N3)-methyltransferase
MIQSRQAWLPVLHEPVVFKDTIRSSQQQNKFIAHCLEGSKGSLQSLQEGDSIILIGPEGDFTEEEVGSAIASGFQPVSLGTNRLRTETAAMAAAVLLCANR